MDIRLLGSVELRTADGRLGEIAGPQRRAVLALLAMELDRVVAVDRFVELLWAEQPPAQARAALQGHIAALRKLLAPGPFILQTRAPGYLLLGPPDQVDTRRFERLAARAADESDDGEAARLLQHALGLWAGAALGDLPDTALRRTLAEQLDESRTGVLMSWAERCLRLDAGVRAVPALEQSVRADGLREPVVALLIRCLHQAGRSADALTVYHQARERLDSELGLPPGRALRAAFAEAGGTAGGEGSNKGSGEGSGGGSNPGPTTVVPPTTPQPSAAPGPAPTPAPAPREAPAPAPGIARHLPRQSSGFVGRGEEFRRLDQECGPDRTGSGLAVLVGPAGVGKSATAIRWAHGAAPGFPDGLLFADLRGFDPIGPVDRCEVLGQFLLALGLPEAAVPQDEADRAALYRERTEHRRLLVLLDNARGPADVVDLLPSGPACATVVTSRNTLEDLVVTEGATLLRLEALPDADALRLLDRALTAGRVQAEPEAAHRLIALCDRLPLALRIAASRLASRPGWRIADLVAELTDERTRLLALDNRGSVSVRTALVLTYRHLSSTATQLLSLLAAHPGREVDALAAAALLGGELRAARRTLGELAAYHLLTENTPGRYTRHDLIRLFSAELFAAEPAEFRRLATDRLLDYYLVAARVAADHLDPGIESFGEPEHPPLSLPQPPDSRAALAWFRPEESTIRALVTTSADDGRHERAWRLARISESLYYGAGRLNDSLTCLLAGLRAAERTGSPQAIAVLEGSCANALYSVGFSAEAVRLVQQAIERTSPADGNTHVRALYTLALITATFGDAMAALPVSAQALALSGDGLLPEHRAAVLSYAAAVRNMAGDSATALGQAREACRLLAAYPAATVRLWAMMNEAQALHQLGLSANAEPIWTSMLATIRDAGFLHLQASGEQGFADYLLDIGRPADAAAHLRAAIDLHQLHGHLADAVTERLAMIEATLADTDRAAPADGLTG
ncbi:winged helix-turn-helix domain-containing protein [Kitasatospora sp. NBC_01287]|uniref:AfsR/SARP family transcriptional regulator n=1 Tax=Kitasatospora sp. NBC_01287 TaxID=2903573 RepID=UPI0022533BA5|nr:BTAD domain-containing putative transcriptional regulator [Kitasatospora sp. NBC_01287]MCX4745839.1 winged helix-turn-helix domain-containing protein [Kitasatospora sp. NBC_01287]